MPRTKETLSKMIQTRRERAAARLHTEFQRGYDLGRADAQRSFEKSGREEDEKGRAARRTAIKALAKLGEANAQLATSIAQAMIDGR
jgi:hypothetical protein